MSGKRYPDEFKIEAVKQVTDRCHTTRRLMLPSVWEVSQHSLSSMDQAIRCAGGRADLVDFIGPGQPTQQP